MTKVLIFAFLTGFSLILGVIIGTSFKISKKTIAAVMAFGTGVLICALTLGLMEESFKHGGFDAIAIGFLMVTAIFLSNLPESLSSINDLKEEGLSKKQIYLTWSVVSAIGIITTILSFIFLKNLNLNIMGIIESFAAGAILAMLADSMMPEAYEEGGYLIGFLTILGFLTAFILLKLSGTLIY